jgi:hypothetical protein
MALFQDFSVNRLVADEIDSADILISKIGNRYFVDPANGNDNNSGSTAKKALKTLEVAYAKTTANKNDIVYLIGNNSSITLTDGIVWAKDYTHLVGLCAPVKIGKRSRIFLLSTAVTPTMVDISANGCVFKNIYALHGVASTASLNCVKVSGQGNYFENFHFAGIGHATGQGDVAAARSLLLYGAAECDFVRCVIGVDTIERSTTNAELECAKNASDLATTRINFDDCIFLSYADAATHLFVKAAASGDIDREIIFTNCSFNNSIGSAATEMTQAFSVHATVGGYFLLRGNTDLAGATYWEASASGNVLISSPAPAAVTSGLAVAVAAA